MSETEPLCAAAWNGNLSEIKELLSKASTKEVNSPNSRGQCALYCAARQGFADIVVELLNFKGIDCDIQVKEHGGTPLHAAVFGKHVVVVALLLARGADPELKNKLGLSARAEAKGDVIDPFTAHKSGMDALLAAKKIKEYFLKKQQKLQEELAVPLKIKIRIKIRIEAKGLQNQKKFVAANNEKDDAKERERQAKAESMKAEEVAKKKRLEEEKEQEKVELAKKQQAQKDQEISRQQEALKQQQQITANLAMLGTNNHRGGFSPVVAQHAVAVDATTSQTNENVELAKALAERNRIELPKRAQFQARQDAIAAERKAATAKAEANNQARIAAKNQSEIRRTQQLKIIDGARAKVQAVIDAHSKKQQAFLNLFTEFEKTRESHIQAGTLAQKEQELSRLETALAAEATAAQTAMAKVHAMEQKFLQVEATRTEEERVQEELEQKRLVEEARRDQEVQEAWRAEEERRRVEEEEWKATEASLVAAFEEKIALEQNQMYMQQQLELQMEQQRLYAQQQAAGGAHPELNMEGLDTQHVVNQLSAALGDQTAPIGSMPIAPSVPTDAASAADYEQQILQEQLLQQYSQLDEDQLQAYHQQQLLQFESQQQQIQQQYEEQLLYLQEDYQQQPYDLQEYENQQLLIRTHFEQLLQQQYEQYLLDQQQLQNGQFQIQPGQEEQAPLTTQDQVNDVNEEANRLLMEQQEIQRQYMEEQRRLEEEEVIRQQQLQLETLRFQQEAAAAQLKQQQEVAAAQLKQQQEAQRAQQEAQQRAQQQQAAQSGATQQQQDILRQQQEAQQRALQAQQELAIKQQELLKAQQEAERLQQDAQRAQQEAQRLQQDALRQQEESRRQQEIIKQQQEALRKQEEESLPNPNASAAVIESQPPPSASRALFQNLEKTADQAPVPVKVTQKSGSVGAMIAFTEARAAASTAALPPVGRGKKFVVPPKNTSTTGPSPSLSKPSNEGDASEAQAHPQPIARQSSTAPAGRGGAFMNPVIQHRPNPLLQNQGGSPRINASSPSNLAVQPKAQNTPIQPAGQS